MKGLDTNVLVRWLLDGSLVEDDSPGQMEAARRTVSRSTEPFLVDNVVLAEATWILHSKVKQSRRQIAVVFGHMLSSPDVVFENDEAVLVALQGYQAHGGDFADHLIGSVNRSLGCSTTFTFDRVAARSPLFTHLKGKT